MKLSKGGALFTKLLNEAYINQITALKLCSEARRLLLERDFDLVIISTPLRDETGESLARNITSNGITQVIIAVQNEYFEAVSAACESDGILTVPKPINRNIFWSSLALAKASFSRMKRLQSENKKLKREIDDIRVVDSAKWVLIKLLNMSEQEAHRHIEKQAMDTRTTKRAVAELILKTYERKCS